MSKFSHYKNMTRILCGSCFAAVVCVSQAQNADVTEDLLQLEERQLEENNLVSLAGEMESVTLYQGMAQVGRRVNLPAEKTGVFEVLISSLPSATDPASVFADEENKVVVRSAVCRVKAYEEQDLLDNQVAVLDEEIHQLVRKINENRNEIALRRIRQDYLRGLQHFVGPAVDAEMANGVIQADQIEAVTAMHFREYEQASQEIMALDFENEDLQKVLQRKREERGQLAQGPPIEYEVVLLVEKTEAGAADLRLNYLVHNCGWTPLYTLRGDLGDSTAQLDFNAQIQQVSGEDWSQVKLTLSTAKPQVSAFNPRLTPMLVGLSSSQMNQQAEEDYLSRQQLAKEQRDSYLSTRLTDNSIRAQAGNMFAANRSAIELQILELESQLGGRSLDLKTEPAIEYVLGQEVSVVSRRNAQVVPVFSREIAAEFYHVAVPVLTENVYHEALIYNDGNQDLLGGDVQVYLQGRFVGLTEIPTVARGRSYPVGFGVDSQLRVLRSVVDRREATQGGNKKISVDMEVAIDNYGEQPVTLHLRERLPWMQDDATLRVHLTQTGLPLSVNPEYLATEKERGILLWELDVPQGSGNDATVLPYSYTLEFDKNMTITDLVDQNAIDLLEEFVEKAESSL